ncbi:DNA-binding GntR family transcriptional regulator [Scopulibacillus daqui]|uniref:DNA-binding GntR family transcriptional regulator n=1 Tax=Scopulibacillus daqui TaxID=1469162 RepID=A0ABS2PVT6_9BACL|nr:GntR family transcriptional regulator [Scopulibacillus daqui]MBM7644161.1 DNA-binding GntR family transcriptional regulator [Scopulibacillus daqui]
MSHTKFKRQAVSDAAYHNIKQKIIDLDYKPDQPLSEEMLTGEMNISRTPLRQALHRLELEGLINRRANGRIAVASVTIEEAEEVFKVREVLEGLIAKEAAQHISSEQIEKLEEVLVVMERAAEKGKNISLIRHGSEFHHILYTAGRNETALRFLEQLNTRIERYRRLGGYLNPQYVPMLPVQEHREIYNCIREHHLEEAEKAMRAHIRRSLALTKKTLRNYFHPNGAKED